MKLAIVSFVAAVAFLPVNADFTLYRIGIGNGIGNAEGWQAYPGEVTNCDEALDWIWRNSDDVSGGKWGVRCKGEDGCKRTNDADPSLSEEIEMNFNSDEYHWTWYRERNNDLVDLDGNVVGNCSPTAAGITLDCGLDPIGQVSGVAKIHCTSDKTAEDIRNQKPAKRAARDFQA